MTTITYPFYYTGCRFGTIEYPKSEGNIKIYLADIVRCCFEIVTINKEKLINITIDDVLPLMVGIEISMTIIEEMTHEFHKGNSPLNHSYEEVLCNFPC